jgi:hypothetical protein
MGCKQESACRSNNRQVMLGKSPKCKGKSITDQSHCINCCIGEEGCNMSLMEENNFDPGFDAWNTEY